MTEYPEADKVSAVKDKSQSIGLFLEWLFSNGNTLCRWQDTVYYDKDGNIIDDGLSGWYTNEPSGYYPVHININELLAEYFHIDLDIYNDEKLQMLEELRTLEKQGQ